MDWTELPVDTLIEIVVRLGVVDWLSFSAVCKEWRRAAKLALNCPRLRPKTEPPWLMLPRSDDPTTADFLSLTDNRCRSITLPHPANQSTLWIGSTNGWLVTADEECGLHLLNPITGVQLSLPSITTTGYFEVLPRTESNNPAGFLFKARSFLQAHRPEHNYAHTPQSYKIPAHDMHLCIFRKAVPLWNHSSGEYFVVMIHGPHDKLVFACDKYAKWVMLPSQYYYEDVIPYKGQFCTVTSCGVFQIWEFDGATFKPRIAAPEHEEEDEQIYFRKYLAESLDGNLMTIWRGHRSSGFDESNYHDDIIDLDRVYRDPTLRFQVFVLHEGCRGSEWREVHDLGGAALFIGYNSAVFFPTDGIPGLMADCIYFTDDNIGNSWHFKQELRDMGVFDMKSKAMKPMSSIVGEVKCWPPPIWITPSIL